MTTKTIEARNQFVDADGIRFAYRRFGKPNGLPLLCMQHYTGTMDFWDYSLIDNIASEREVILFDYRGVGLTTGETANRVTQMAEDSYTFMRAIGLHEVDLLGFSIGGFVAQEFTLKYPQAVRKLILAGTGPRGGVGMLRYRQDVVDALTGPGGVWQGRDHLFFSESDNGKAQAKAFIARCEERIIDVDRGSQEKTFGPQGEAIKEWGDPDQHKPFLERLKGLTARTLIMNGYDDIMVPTPNSNIMFEAIPNSQLILYPDSGHGALFQYGPLFAQHVNMFLDRDDF